VPNALIDDIEYPRYWLKDNAVAALVARDERLRHSDGTPHHNEIISATGLGMTQWWRIRQGCQSAGKKSVPKLLRLAMSTGLTRDEAWELLFTTEPRQSASSAA
jgi:hypothetical protein